MYRSALALAIATLFTPSWVAAQYQQIDAAVDRMLPEITRIRHHLHQHPELGNREFETAALVAEYLRELGFDQVQTGVAHTGVVAVLEGGKPGPVVALRADMDALPVTEDTPYPWKSTVRATYLGQDVGVSHACGHDIHTSVQLGVATVLMEMRDELPGTVKFIFQPAEEGPPPGETGACCTTPTPRPSLACIPCGTCRWAPWATRPGRRWPPPTTSPSSFGEPGHTAPRRI